METTLKQYQMDKVLEVAEQASNDITKFLYKIPNTIGVINVEKDKRFQKQDIDLIWLYEHENKILNKSIEIKGDRWSSGNMFFETISNIQKNTQGCFMYCEATDLYYYFVNEKELYILPMKKTREWFLENIKRFQRKFTSTGDKDGCHYTSEGRVVSRLTIERELGIKPINIKRYIEGGE